MRTQGTLMVFCYVKSSPFTSVLRQFLFLNVSLNQGPLEKWTEYSKLPLNYIFIFYHIWIKLFNVHWEHDQHWYLWCLCRRFHIWNTLTSVILPVLRCLTPQSTTWMQLESSPPNHFVTCNLMSYPVHFFRSPCLNTKATATTAVFPGLHLFFNWHGKLSVIKVFAGFHGHRWQLFRDFHLKKCKENIKWGEIISEVEFAFPCVCLIICLDAFIEGWMSVPVWI